MAKVIAQKESALGRSTSVFEFFNTYYFRYTLASIVFYMFSQQFDQSIIPSNNKQEYQTFDKFYPLYVSEHQNAECRMLHFVGTSLVLCILLSDSNLLFSLMPALMTGLGLRTVTKSMEHGLFELTGMMYVFCKVHHGITGNFRKPLRVLLVGYGFAWVGHFVFELNRPATFVHSIFSLFGDFRMWYDMVTTNEPWTYVNSKFLS